MIEDLPIQVDAVFGCYIWTGETTADGYGKHNGKLAHRYVFEALIGPIAEGMELDHSCRRTLCVRPTHLEPVDRSTNERLKVWRNRAKRTKCPRNHDLNRTRIVSPEGGVICRSCNQGEQ